MPIEKSCNTFVLPVPNSSQPLPFIAGVFLDLSRKIFFNKAGSLKGAYAMQPKHPAWKDMIGARVLAVILFVIGIGGVIFLPTVLPNPNSWFASLIFFAFCCIHALGFLLESNEHAKKCGSNPRTRATDRYWDAISTKGKNSSDAIMIRDEWRDDEEFQKIADAWDRRIERTIACQRNNAS